MALPDFCPACGTELHDEKDGLAERVACGECAFRTHDTLLDGLLWRLHPDHRAAVSRSLDRLVVGPHHPDSGWVRLRIAALLAIPIGVGVSPISDLLKLIGGVGLVVGFAMLLNARQRIAEDREDLTRPEKPRRSDAVLVGVAGLSIAAGFLASNVTLAGITGAELPDTSIEAFATTAAQVAVPVAVGRPVGTILHEQLHLRAMRLVGHDGRIQYDGPRVMGRTIPTSGTVWPQPVDWNSELWQSSLVSFAPLVLSVAAWGVLLVGSSSLPLWAIIGGLVLVMMGLPSPGDMGAFKMGWRYTVADAYRAVRDHHAPAEGVTL